MYVKEFWSSYHSACECRCAIISSLKCVGEDKRKYFWVNGVRVGAGHEVESELTMLARWCPRAAWLGEHCTLPGSTSSYLTLQL